MESDDSLGTSQIFVEGIVGTFIEKSIAEGLTISEMREAADSQERHISEAVNDALDNPKKYNLGELTGPEALDDFKGILSRRENSSQQKMWLVYDEEELYFRKHYGEEGLEWIKDYISSGSECDECESELFYDREEERKYCAVCA